nr:MAG TPA: hypothetical protein [Caudoviricetes sp.]
MFEMEGIEYITEYVRNKNDYLMEKCFGDRLLAVSGNPL